MRTKFILFIVAAAVSSALVFQSCSDSLSTETLDVVKSKPAKVKQEFLDLDVANIRTATDLQRKIFNEALKRIDPYVVYENKSFHLTINNGKEINISERLFEKMNDIINQTNLIISDLNVISDIKDNRKLHVKNNVSKSSVRFKVASENTTGGGISDYFIRWYGVDIYVTNKQLQLLALGSSGVALAGSFAPEPAVSKAVALVAGLGSLYFGYCAIEYTQGAVFETTWILTWSSRAQ